MKCKICGEAVSFFDKADILGKYPATFLRCTKCGFIQAEQAYWLEASYSSVINASDIGLVRRNIDFSNTTMNLILACFNPTQKFLDYGGGYGLFVRLMRDKGFDFYRHDPLCRNLFAEGFEAIPNTNYALVTAWEVFEHLEDPLAEIEQMVSYSRNLFFSTWLLPKVPKPMNEWWYYGIEHGQHISFYSRETLDVIAHKFNLRLLYSSGFLHLMVDRSINPHLISIAFDQRFKWLRKIFLKPSPPSLLEKDYLILTGKELK
jgi:hypothetical protein